MSVESEHITSPERVSVYQAQSTKPAGSNKVAEGALPFRAWRLRGRRMLCVTTVNDIIQRLNDCWPKAQEHVSQGNILLAADADVTYEGTARRISRQSLVRPEQFQEKIGPTLAGGPSWIHANVIPMPDSRFLVTIAAGARIGNAHPSINISHELGRLVETTN